MQVLVYGSGQLARMMYLAGAPLSIDVLAVDVATRHVVHPISKALVSDDLAGAIAAADHLTVEFEHVPEDLLAQASASGKLAPNMEAVLVGADRVREKQLLEQLHVANCQHEIITDVAQLTGICERLGDRIIFKASRDGYDGYGQWRCKSAADLPALEAEFATLDLQQVPLVAERMSQFSRELSLLGARNARGDVAIYPLAENCHHDGQLHVSVAPAPHYTDALAAQALDIFTKIATELDYIGVLAVELFQEGETLLVNELAPRVHNSGHWSMHGSVTCQFENHLRAVCNMPLGATQANGVSAMVNIIGCEPINDAVLGLANVHPHWYGKSVRHKRKMGHINVNAPDYASLSQYLLALDAQLPGEFFPELASEAKKLLI
jgi:5-(carboxyamino)imidazole ribonucleotide synthase